MTDCFVCGKCYWQDCSNDADYVMHVDLKRGGLPLFAGDVDLCGGHKELAHKTGRMDLKWEALEQALALQETRT